MFLSAPPHPHSLRALFAAKLQDNTRGELSAAIAKNLSAADVAIDPLYPAKQISAQVATKQTVTLVCVAATRCSLPLAWSLRGGALALGNLAVQKQLRTDGNLGGDLAVTRCEFVSLVTTARAASARICHPTPARAARGPQKSKSPRTPPETRSPL